MFRRNGWVEEAMGDTGFRVARGGAQELYGVTPDRADIDTTLDAFEAAVKATAAQLR